MMNPLYIPKYAHLVANDTNQDMMIEGIEQLAQQQDQTPLARRK
jgi:hypothetical protein